MTELSEFERDRVGERFAAKPSCGWCDTCDKNFKAGDKLAPSRPPGIIACLECEENGRVGDWIRANPECRDRLHSCDECGHAAYMHSRQLSDHIVMGEGSCMRCQCYAFRPVSQKTFPDGVYVCDGLSLERNKSLEQKAQRWIGKRGRHNRDVYKDMAAFAQEKHDELVQRCEALVKLRDVIVTDLAQISKETHEMFTAKACNRLLLKVLDDDADALRGEE